MELINMGLIRNLWARQHVDWVYLSSIGASRGILVMCNRRVVEKLEEVVGQFLVSCRFRIWGIILNGRLPVYFFLMWIVRKG